MAQFRHLTTPGFVLSPPDTSQISGLTPFSVGSAHGDWTADIVPTRMEEHLAQCRELAPHWLESGHVSTPDPITLERSEFIH